MEVHTESTLSDQCVQDRALHQIERLACQEERRSSLVGTFCSRFIDMYRIKFKQTFSFLVVLSMLTYHATDSSPKTTRQINSQILFVPKHFLDGRSISATAQRRRYPSKHAAKQNGTKLSTDLPKFTEINGRPAWRSATTKLRRARAVRAAIVRSTRRHRVNLNEPQK